MHKTAVVEIKRWRSDYYPRVEFGLLFFLSSTKRVVNYPTGAGFFDMTGATYTDGDVEGEVHGVLLCEKVICWVVLRFAKVLFAPQYIFLEPL